MTDYRLERKEAELNLMKLESAFSTKKASGGVSEADKAHLREIREAYRRNYRLPVIDGAAPGAISGNLFQPQAKSLWQKFMDMMGADA
jgi:hypothetical protein